MIEMIENAIPVETLATSAVIALKVETIAIMEEKIPSATDAMRVVISLVIAVIVDPTTSAILAVKSATSPANARLKPATFPRCSLLVSY